jgi:hypothetical protein
MREFRPGQVLRRKLDDDHRVEISSFGFVVYSLGGRTPLVERSWDQGLASARKNSTKKKGGVSLANVIERVWLELDDLRETQRRILATMERPNDDD